MNKKNKLLFKSSDHVLSCKEIEKVLEDKGFEGISVIDYAETAEQSRNLVVIIKVFSYGFIVLISLIAAANVFNTISTNISLRRREFAMLKSVGMTSRGFNRMMNYECVLYGSRALFLGLPVSIGITFLSTSRLKRVSIRLFSCLGLQSPYRYSVFLQWFFQQ